MHSVGLKTLDGVSGLLNLTLLEVSFNQIRDLRPISQIPLQSLSMISNLVEDISCLNVSSLTILNLSYNCITNITALKNAY